MAKQTDPHNCARDQMPSQRLHAHDESPESGRLEVYGRSAAFSLALGRLVVSGMPQGT